MKGLYLDHVLIAVHDLQVAAKTYSEALGFTLTPEGVHPGRGTHNRIMAFGLEYLELIAIHDPTQREGDLLQAFLQSREGIYSFALGAGDIEGAISGLRRRSVTVEDPRMGERVGDSGRGGYTWRSAHIAPEATPGCHTFLIQHDHSIKQRYTEPANPHLHANGVAGVHHLSLAVSDCQAAASRWARSFGIEAAPIEELPPQGIRRAMLKLQNCYLELVSPLREGEVSTFLDEYGEAPYLLALNVRDLLKTRAFLMERGVSVGKMMEDSVGRTCAVHADDAHCVRLRLVQSPAER